MPAERDALVKLAAWETRTGKRTLRAIMADAAGVGPTADCTVRGDPQSLSARNGAGALRSLARRCTFDPFLRLATIHPLFWVALPTNALIQASKSRRAIKRELQQIAA